MNQEKILFELDREVQEFLFSYLGSLIDEMLVHANDGFDDAQVRAIDNYFVRVATVLAIAYPYRLLPFYMGRTHHRVRCIQRLFLKWVNESEHVYSSSEKMRKYLSQMQDELAKLSISYRLATSKKYLQKRADAIESSLIALKNAVVIIGKCGLKSMASYVERRMSQNNTIQTSNETASFDAGESR